MSNILRGDSCDPIACSRSVGRIHLSPGCTVGGFSMYQIVLVLPSKNTLDNGCSPTNLCYKSVTIVTNLSSFISICFLDIYLVCHGGGLHNQTSSATMDKCADLRKYAFPDICLLNFVFLF